MKRQGKRLGGGSAKRPVTPLSARQVIAAALAAAEPRPGEKSGSTEQVERFGNAHEQIGELTIPVTLKEACALIGQHVEPHRVGATALEALAEELDAVTALIAEGDSSETWRVTASIVERARFAAKIERHLST